jgi:hypothetical protein
MNPNPAAPMADPAMAPNNFFLRGPKKLRHVSSHGCLICETNRCLRINPYEKAGEEPLIIYKRKALEVQSPTNPKRSFSLIVDQNGKNKDFPKLLRVDFAARWLQLLINNRLK